MKWKTLGLIAYLIINSGCYLPLKVESEIPLARFEPSLIKNKESKFTVGASYAPVEKVTVDDDATRGAPGTATSSYAANLLAHLGYNPSSRLELELRQPIVLGGGSGDARPLLTQAKIKYQVLGLPFSDAKEGDWSSALTGGFGYGSDEGSSYSTTARLDSYLYDFAAVGGRMVSDTVLIYGGPHYSQITTFGSIARNISGPEVFDLKAYGSNTGAAFGLFGSFNKKKLTYFTLELGYNYINYTRMESKSELHLGAMLDIKL